MVVETQTEEVVQEDMETAPEVELEATQDETNNNLEGETNEHQEDVEEDADGGVEISLDGESLTPEKEEAPSWVKELRKTNREQSKRLKELEAQLVERNQVSQGLGEKPTLEAFEYDEDKYEKALESWYDKKREFDAREAEQKAKEQEAINEWNDKLTNYQQSKTELKVKDFDDVEGEVMGVLNETQQGVIVEIAKNPALVVYAIGKNPKRAASLSQITNLLQFAAEIGVLEKGLTIKEKAPKPAPEKVVSSTGGKSGNLDTQLERLRKEAEKTGDYSQVMAYKNKLKQQQ